MSWVKGYITVSGRIRRQYFNERVYGEERREVWFRFIKTKPTELVEFHGVDMKANALVMKLNINAGHLFKEYGISF